MNMKEDNGRKVAEFLLQIKAVELNPQNPFTWASGWKSPIYCDNRKTLSYPQIRTFIRQQFVETINQHFGKPEVIAGVATGGIAIGALIAQDLGIPFVYIRSSAKDHGLGNQIEGVLEVGKDVVVIEDLISTGKSSLKAVEAIRQAGGNVKGLLAIFSYGFDVSINAFEEAKCPIRTLTDYTTLVYEALSLDYIDQNSMLTLEEWREDPAKWSEKFSSEVEKT